jgi:hypothetical protein
MADLLEELHLFLVALIIQEVVVQVQVQTVSLLQTHLRQAEMVAMVLFIYITKEYNKC